MKNIFPKNKGFTLVEMLVVLVIFSIVIGAAIGVFVSAVRVQRYTLASQRLLDQTSYVMEYVGRSLRMAKKELNDGTPDCLFLDGLNYEENVVVSGVGVDLLFKDYLKRCKGFFLQGGQLKEYEAGRIPKILPLTSDKLEITSFNVNLSGQNQTDDLQPRVTFFLEIKGRAPGPEPEIKIQTTVSQRDLDIEE